jgi:hypothetical protein
MAIVKKSDAGKNVYSCIVGKLGGNVFYSDEDIDGEKRKIVRSNNAARTVKGADEVGFRAEIERQRKFAALMSFLSYVNIAMFGFSARTGKGKKMARAFKCQNYDNIFVETPNASVNPISGENFPSTFKVNPTFFKVSRKTSKRYPIIDAANYSVQIEPTELTVMPSSANNYKFPGFIQFVGIRTNNEAEVLEIVVIRNKLRTDSDDSFSVPIENDSAIDWSFYAFFQTEDMKDTTDSVKLV